MELKVKRSKTGLPVLAETGGGATNIGSAMILCGERGEALKPLYIPKGVCWGNHALFVARAGMYIVNHFHNRNHDSIQVFKILGIGSPDDPDDVIMAAKPDYEWEDGDGNIPEFLKAAVKAANEKGYCYHCRAPHFISKQRVRS